MSGGARRPPRILRTAIFLALAALPGNGRTARAAEPAEGLNKAAHSGVEYYLSLPNGWNPDEKWPILVTIDGAGHNFKGNFGGFTNARGASPFIIVTPCVSSNGNDPADLDAVLEIVREVTKRAGGQPKFFITGFSAGGHLAWQLVFNHPELLAGAAPAAANFRFRGVANISRAPERVTLPVHGFLGGKDGIRAALSGQWKDAADLARRSGYENVTLTEVPGADHKPFPQQVIAFFASLLPKRST